MKMGLFTVEGELLDKWEIPTRTENGGEAVLPDIAASIREKLAERAIGAQDVEGIGIGVSGLVDVEFTVHKCINLGWGMFNLKEAMNALLPEIPNVAAGNDANVATLGELWKGGGMSRAGSIVTDSITAYYRKYAFHVSVETPIVLAELGKDAGIYGCAKMVFSA